MALMHPRMHLAYSGYQPSSVFEGVMGEGRDKTSRAGRVDTKRASWRHGENGQRYMALEADISFTRSMTNPGYNRSR